MTSYRIYKYNYSFSQKPAPQRPKPVEEPTHLCLHLLALFPCRITQVWEMSSGSEIIQLCSWCKCASSTNLMTNPDAKIQTISDIHSFYTSVLDVLKQSVSLHNKHTLSVQLRNGSRYSNTEIYSTHNVVTVHNCMVLWVQIFRDWVTQLQMLDLPFTISFS